VHFPPDISPQSLGFVPSDYWLNADYSFGELVSRFFHRKNRASYALRLVDGNPTMFNLVGVKWLTEMAFLVNKLIFGRLLGISALDGASFIARIRGSASRGAPIPGARGHRRLPHRLRQVQNQPARLWGL
jgi:hypothetical protein